MAAVIKRLDLEIEENKGVVRPSNNIQCKSREKKREMEESFFCALKRTGSPEGLGFSWHVWIDLELKKGRRWILNFSGAPSIIH